MLSLIKPCEPPAHSIWHLVSGMITLAAIWGAGVLSVQWLWR